jgi:threonine/homoserine/homoserine lactone efflux protein
MPYAWIYLMALGFAVGLSGALIPGPLLVYTIRESLDRGRWTGLKTIAGHAIVEVGVVLVIALGVSGFVNSPIFFRLVSILGGVFLVYIAAAGFRDTKIDLSKVSAPYGPIVGGVIFTAFNPSFLPWWVTAGSRLLLEGYLTLGVLGAALVFVGHWVADFGWYITVSMTTDSKKHSIIERGWYLKLKKILSSLMLAIGVYFAYTGVTY